MKNIILNFLRPYVILILKDALKITTTKNVVTKIVISSDPPTGIPPIIPVR